MISQCCVFLWPKHVKGLLYDCIRLYITALCWNISTVVTKLLDTGAAVLGITGRSNLGIVEVSWEHYRYKILWWRVCERWTGKGFGSFLRKAKTTLPVRYDSDNYKVRSVLHDRYSAAFAAGCSANCDWKQVQFTVFSSHGRRNCLQTDYKSYDTGPLRTSDLIM